MATGFNNTSESTKLTRTFNSSSQGLKKKSSVLWQQQKQDFFEQEDKEEELQFILLCQTLDKVK